MSTAEQFDIIVIGSSPILVLYALHHQAMGKRVCLMEKNATLGGAWKIKVCPKISDEYLLETSCHLAEWYDGGYELLESLSNETFPPALTPQPVKVFETKRTRPYTTRLETLKGLVAWSYRMPVGLLRLIISFVSRDTANTRKRLQNLKLDFGRLHTEITKRAFQLHKYPRVREPAGGFAAWMKRQIDRLANSSVRVLHEEVFEVQRMAPFHWEILTRSGKKFEASLLVMGQSACIEKWNGAGEKKPVFSQYFHVVISVRSNDVLIRNRYIHCVENKFVHRLSYLFDSVQDDGMSRSFWLVQCRVSEISIDELNKHLKKITQNYRFFKLSAVAQIVLTINGEYVQSSDDAAFQVVTESDCLVLRTIGDLTRNILFANEVQKAFA